MINLLKLLSFLSLTAILTALFMHYFGTVDYKLLLGITIVSTVTWFVATPFWMKAD